MARKKNIESEIETPAFDVEAAIARAVETPAPSANSLSEEAEAIRQQLAEESAAPREATRPDISRLHDAVADGVPLFGPGDRIIIERRAVVLKGTPYLDTRTYRVRSVDPETGLMRLWDEALNQWAMDNFRTGAAVGQVYKLANGVTAAVGQRKRGRPRKNPIAPPAEVPAEGAAPKRGRGRPKGSKNRDRSVIVAEKAARREKRAIRRGGV